MESNTRLAALLLLAALPAAGLAVEPSGSPAGSGATDASRPPSTTQTAPAQPYGSGTTTNPGSATTTDGSTGVPGTLPPGTSPRDASATMGRQAEVPPLFGELDINKDGYVVREETKRSADTTARFDEIDADRDGRISVSEWKAAEDRKVGR